MAVSEKKRKHPSARKVIHGAGDTVRTPGLNGRFANPYNTKIYYCNGL